MLELAHREHGRMTWSSLFDPAIALATRGFRISPRMSESIAGSRTGLARDAEAAAYFLEADGSAKAAGTLLKNPALASTLATIARGGADAFYTGDLAQAVVDRIADTREGTTPGRTTLADLAGYRREASRSGLRPLPRVHRLRHGAAVLGRHRGRERARHPRAVRHRGASTESARSGRRGIPTYSRST